MPPDPSARKERVPARHAVGAAVLARRVTGGLLVLLVALPSHRLLSGAGGGVAAQQVVRAADGYYGSAWLGLSLLLALCAAVALVAPKGLVRWLDTLGELLARPRAVAFAAGVAAMAGLLAVWVSLGVFHGKPVLGDAMTQLLHGRYLAAGQLAGPPLEQPEFWNMQFMVDTKSGWVSQYPPMHAVVLAVGLMVGAVWVVGPLAMAATAFLMCLVAERLLPGQTRSARLGAVLVGVSPLLLGLASSYMNHATAAAWAAAAAYFALRALDGRWAWSIAAGTCVGAMVATRPFSGLVVGSVVTLGVWLWTGAPVGRGRRVLRLAAGLALGGLPWAVGLALYNAHFFGSPLQLGYLAAAGPSHALGFHVDPWGNFYGPTLALGYTGADLMALGRDLVGSPASITVLVGLYLAIATRLTSGERVLVAWALLPVAANAFYWHHDLVLGPRMLGEAAPAWCLLVAVGGVALVRAVPPALPRISVVAPRAGLAGALLLALVLGVGYLGPRQLAQLGERVGPEPVLRPPESSTPTLAFVHEAWEDRLGARLAERGLRLDSVRALLRRYSPCRLQLALDAPSRATEAVCRRQAAADRFGVLALPALAWQGDLPGLRPTGTMWVRDLGPEQNARVLEEFPDRKPMVLVPPVESAGWSLVPFDEGMALLWGVTP